MSFSIPTDLTRPQLMARLAGERAYLLASFIGLDEAAISGSPLYHDWQVKDIFPHIGRWDEMFTSWISLLQQGREADLPILDETQINQTWHEQHKRYTLEQGVAVFLKGRRGLWAGLERLTDEELDRPITLATGRETTVRRWIAAAYRHDAEHAQEIRAWRKNNNIPRTSGSLCLLRALIRATRNAFLTVAATLPEDEKSRRPVCGTWTLQDVIGHITDWEAYGVEGITKVLAGDTALVSPYGADIQAWNEAHAAARQGQSWEQVWNDYQTTRQNFFYALDQLTQADLARTFHTPWGTMTLYQWVTIWAHHEQEHTADLRRELALPDTPDHLLPRH